MELTLCKPEYWNFVGQLRSNPKVAHGFCETSFFDEDKQTQFMINNSKYFHICMFGPYTAGYVGLIGEDRNEITYCTHPDFQGRGVGTFMIKEIMQLSPNIWAKVKPENLGSIRVFEKLNFKREDKQDFVYFYQK